MSFSLRDRDRDRDRDQDQDKDKDKDKDQDQDLHQSILHHPSHQLSSMAHNHHQERPLLSSHGYRSNSNSNDQSSFPYHHHRHPSTKNYFFKPGRTSLRSRLSTALSVIIIILLSISIDRYFLRDFSAINNDPSINSIFDTNYHLTNSIISHVCNLIPATNTSTTSTSTSSKTRPNPSAPSFSELLNNKFCIKPLRDQQKILKASYRPDDGNDFGPSMNRQWDNDTCLKLFPNLYQELDRSMSYHLSKGNITLHQIDEAVKYSHARVLIYKNRVYIKQFNGGPGKRTEALLNSIQEAVITSPELLPDIEFVIKSSDAPQGGDDQHPIWVLDRTQSQEEVWLMPDYGFYSWPEPKVGGMIEVRDKTAQREAQLSWDKKTPKAFWRGAILVPLRQQLLEISKRKPWSDIGPIVWQNLNGGLTTPEDHCNFKFLIHTEGYAYSGRLKYLQMCRSVVVAHRLQYIQHFHHLLDSRPHSPTQNIAIVEGPGFEGLDKLMDELIANDRWSESIANNSLSLFRHYLSPAGVHCYWRQLFRSWAQVQAFTPERNPKDTPFESFNLMHSTDWAAH